MRSPVVIASLLLASTASAGPPPEWFGQNLQRLTADGGVWIADNSAYVSEQERFTEYGLHWQAGIGGHSAIGRLYGLIDGEEAGSFWQFRLYWHPGQDQAILQQFGAGGAVLSGTMSLDEDGRERLLQDFWAPDGSHSQVGHLTEWPEPDVHIGSSYQVDEQGQWIEQRSYRWVRRKG